MQNNLDVSDEWLTITADEPLPQISMANVIKKLKGIDAKKAYGPFDPSTKIIKLFAGCFAVPLVHIFNILGCYYWQSRDLLPLLMG